MKIGFIGTGNMGSAIINGLVVSKFVSEKEINIFEILEEMFRFYGRERKAEILKNSR